MLENILYFAGWGGGGFGDVYLGKHLHEHTQVAIKVLHARLTRHDDLKEFINEARTIHLKHPHIVSLLDFGISSDDTPFLVMTYAPHGTLRDRHPKGSQLPLSIIVSYVQQLASALHYAHSLHLVHRDVKPENMLVGSSHEILLSDFGIAQVVHSSSSLATENGIGGTLPYMAPEQIAGKPRTSTDQYALGIVVYEWITGRRPFTGTAAEVAMQHTTTLPSSLREHIPRLPIDVEQVVLKALAKDPKNRYADIEAFANALEQASQQAEALKPPLERSLSVRSSIPVQDPIAALPPKTQANVVNPAFMDSRFAPIPADSFSRVEGIALVTKPVDGLAASPTIPQTIHKYSRQKPTLFLLPPTASIEIPQRLHRRRLSWRSATLLLVLALLILGSAWGLYATVHNSTTRTVETSTTNAHTTSDSGAGSLSLVNINSSPSSGPVCDTTATTNAHATTGSLVSCPFSGPEGATISVSGSGWPEPDGEQVSLGYMMAAFCSTVPDSQASTFKSGSFSGSLHLPSGTPLGTYSICANFGSTTAVANTYTVLTESAPQISISLSTQAGKQQATISGFNYFPAGTTVNLFWQTTNGSTMFTITPAVSNSNGLISRTFLIPRTVASGSYKIVANVAQQPTLSSSATFTYNAPNTS